MNPQTTQTLESFSLDGPIGIGTALVAGIVLASVFAWVLWSQWRVLGRPRVAAFWLLRVTAAGLVLWMLLGPGWTTRQKITTVQSVAVLVDTSHSMDVADPSVTTQQHRWMLASQGDEGDPAPVTSADRAQVSLAGAIERSALTRQTLLQHQSREDVRTGLQRTEAAVHRTVEHLQTIVDSQTDLPVELRDRSDRLLSRIIRIGTDLQELRETWVAKADRRPDELSDALLDVEDQCTDGERRLQQLREQLAQQSMEGATAAGGDQALARRDQVRQTLAAIQQELQTSGDEAAHIQPLLFGDTAALASLDSGWEQLLDSQPPTAETADSRPRTNLSAALDQLSRSAASASIQSAVLITDGAHNATDSLLPQEMAESLGNLPVHVVPIGHTEFSRDIQLYRVDVPTAVDQGDAILIDIIVTAQRCGGEDTRLILRENGRQVDEQILTFTRSRMDIRTSFELPADELGPREFELEVVPLEDEASTTNNTTEMTVTVVRENLDVLLVDGVARWEYRYLEQLFRRDELINFEKLLFAPELRATGESARRGGFPRDLSGWSRYDVVILGDVEPQHFPDHVQQQLAEWVQKNGGQLVVIAGQHAMPQAYRRTQLMELLPVRRARQSGRAGQRPVSLTSAGRQHPGLSLADSPDRSEQIWQSQFQTLPLHWVSEFSRPKETSEALMAVAAPGPSAVKADSQSRQPEQALMCWHRSGAGRVLYLSAPSTWRLRVRRGDRYHHRFWGQMLRWLTAADRSAGSQLVRITTDRVLYEAGEAVGVSVRLTDHQGRAVAGAAPRLVATSSSAPAVQVELTEDDRLDGRYTGVLSGLKPGAWTVTAEGADVEQLLSASTGPEEAEARFTVTSASNPEMVNTRCQTALLNQIAEVTGGQVVSPTAIGELLRMSGQSEEVSEQVHRRPIWNRWWLLLLAFGCLLVEWVSRKRLGLV